MLARHYDSMGRNTIMYTDIVGPTRRPRFNGQSKKPTPVNHQDPCTTWPPTQRHPGVHHFGSALPTQRAENGASLNAGQLGLVDVVLSASFVLVEGAEEAWCHGQGRSSRQRRSGWGIGSRSAR